VTEALRDLDSIQRDFERMLKALTRIALDPGMSLERARALASETVRELEGDAT
jgi:hypothetical protein